MTLTRFCTSCGQPISAASSICHHCGVLVQRTCPACGAATAADSRFCSSCGAPQSMGPTFSAPRPREDRITTERREVTVVFVDATDFTATSTRLDVEDVYLFIDEAMKLLAEVVSDYEGTIDKFTGDGLMALFGAPLAHENDAERAVRAAWEMQRVIRPFRERLRAQHGFDFRIRIGVHTGEVIAGQIGSRAHAEYTAIGDTVNLAARLQTAAEPDSVLVSGSTYERTAMNFRYEAVPPLTLKGFLGGVTAFRLAGVTPAVGAQRGVPGVTVPLVGREIPLAGLHDSLRRMREGRTMEVACVSGEAGVGKTRLVHELIASPQAQEANVIVTRCIALTRSRPLAAVADLVRRIIGSDESDPPQAQMEAIWAFVATNALDADHTPYLAGILGVAHTDPAAERRLAGLNEEMLKDQTQLAVRALLVAAARRQPAIVVADDLHWADSASLDTLQSLVASCAEEPLLLLLVTRRTERETLLQPLLRAAAARTQHFLDLALEPLTESDAKLFLRQIIRGDGFDAQRLRQRIIARAEGNPFYVEELVRMLLDRGGLTGEPGDWKPTTVAERVLQDLPSSLRGLIITRFDALPHELRRVLQRAAILGRSFPVRLLEQLVDTTEEVGALLAELERRDFLEQESFGLEKGYAFRHVLIQEAIHSTILKRDRQELHRQVAETVAAGGFWSPAERNEALAYHWSESAEPQRAVPFLLAVAEGSARRYVNDAAVDRCSRALAILANAPDPEQQIRAELLLGRALKFLGRLAEARDALQSGTSSVYAQLSVGDAEPQRITLFVELLRELADVKAREGALDEAAAHLDEAMLALSSFGATHLRHAIAERLAWVRFRQGKLDDALMLAHDLASKLDAEPSADPTLVASVYNTLGGVLWHFGKLDQAAVYVRQSLTLYHRIGYLFGKANAHTNLGILNYTQGKWPEAAESFERSDWIRRETGCIVGRSTNLLNLGMLRTAMGQHAAARADLEASVRVSMQLGEEIDTIRALIALLHLSVIEGKLDEAAERIDALRGRHLQNEDLAQFEWLRAVVVASRGEVPEAIEIATGAANTARRCGVPDTEADCVRILGTLKLRAGDREGAVTSLRQALELSLKVGDPYRQGLATLELGVALADTHMIEEAANVFTILGAAHDLDRALEKLGTEGVA